MSAVVEHVLRLAWLQDAVCSALQVAVFAINSSKNGLLAGEAMEVISKRFGVAAILQLSHHSVEIELSAEHAIQFGRAGEKLSHHEEIVVL